MAAVALSPDGKLIVIGSAGSPAFNGPKVFLKIWDTLTGAEVSIVVGVRCGWRGEGGGLMAFRACCATLEVPQGGAAKFRRLLGGALVA